MEVEGQMYERSAHTMTGAVRGARSTGLSGGLHSRHI